MLHALFEWYYRTPRTSYDVCTAVRQRNSAELQTIIADCSKSVITIAVATLIIYDTLDDLKFLLSHNPPRNMFGRVDFESHTPNDSSPDTGTLLHLLVSHGLTTRISSTIYIDNTVQALQALSAFVSIHEYTDDYEPLISTAAAMGHIKVVEELIRLGASLNGVPNPPLFNAIYYKKYAQAKYLIDAGALPIGMLIKEVIKDDYPSEWLELIFLPRAVDVTMVETTCPIHLSDKIPCSTTSGRHMGTCNNIPRWANSTVATEPLHVHLRNHPEYFAYTRPFSASSARKLELLVKNGADPASINLIYCNQFEYVQAVARGALYRTAIYTYLCARSAYGRDIAKLIAQAILKLIVRPEFE